MPSVSRATERTASSSASFFCSAPADLRLSGKEKLGTVSPPAFAVVVKALRYRRSQADPSDKTGQSALIPVHKRGMRQTRDWLAERSNFELTVPFPWIY
jgi:hypothetical protein